MDREKIREKMQDTYGVIRYGVDAYERYKSGRNIPDSWNLFQYELNQILALSDEQVEELFVEFHSMIGMTWWQSLKDKYLGGK